MAKKTITKEHPLTAFRKANEARNAMVKKSITKYQLKGEVQGPLSKEDSQWIDRVMEYPSMKQNYNTSEKIAKRKFAFEDGIRESPRFNTTKIVHDEPKLVKKTGGAVKTKKK
jgi:hypothetical protein